MIAVIDYNVGNLGSVKSAMARLGLDVVVTRDPETILQADGVILPGVGAFPAAMKRLNDYGLTDVLKQVKDKDIPLLGICLGMQILFEESDEVTPTKGLGLLEGKVTKIPTTAKLPHMGWNQLVFNHDHKLLGRIDEGDYVYFVHSYCAQCPDDELYAYAEYGGVKVPGLVAKGSVMGTQFHPEKSGEVGRLILESFKEMVQ